MLLNSTNNSGCGAISNKLLYYHYNPLSLHNGGWTTVVKGCRGYFRDPLFGKWFPRETWKLFLVHVIRDHAQQREAW